MENCRKTSQSSAAMLNPGDARKDSPVAAKDSSLAVNKDFELLSLHNGKIEFPDWASDVTSILLMISSQEVHLQLPSLPGQGLVAGVRTIALKLEFGISNNQFYGNTVFPSEGHIDCLRLLG